MRTLVLGMGNPILSDDGVGIHVAKELEGRIARGDVTVVDTSLSGLGLLDALAGYDKAIIIDAITTAEGRAGQIYQLDPEALDATRHAASPHDVNFATALELGKRLGLALPTQIVIYAIEVADAGTFGEECTPDVSQAIPICVKMIIKELNRDYNT